MQKIDIVFAQVIWSIFCANNLRTCPNNMIYKLLDQPCAQKIIICVNNYDKAVEHQKGALDENTCTLPVKKKKLSLMTSEETKSHNKVSKGSKR